MFFQVNITPKEQKAPRSTIKSPVINSYKLQLAPFQPPTRIRLDTKVNNPVECTIIIDNTNQRSLTASITKIPPQERFLSLSATEWSIQPESNVILTILWEPKEGGTWRDILQLTDSRRIKYDIPLTLTCTDPSKIVNSSKNRTKRNILGSKTNSISNTQKSSLISGKTIVSQEAKKIIPKPEAEPAVKRVRPARVVFADKENVSSNVGINWMLDQAKTKKEKEDRSPDPSIDFSKYLNSSEFKFTPFKSKFTCFGSNEAQNSVPFTPTHYQNIDDTQESLLFKQESLEISQVQMTLRKETYVTVPKYINVQPCPIVTDDEQDKDEFDDSLSPKPVETETVKMKSDFSVLLDDFKFTPYKSSNTKQIDTNFSPDYCSTGTKTIKKQPVDDDLANEFTTKNTTFDIDSTSNSEANNTYELPTSPKSANSSFHLKPTCLAKTFDKENANLEFSTPLPVARFNAVNNSVRCSSQFSKSQIDCGSAKDCLEADLWVKNRSDSVSPIAKSLMHSTLDSIREEDIHTLDGKKKSLVSFDIPEKSSNKPKAVCIEISPPKKYNRKPCIRKISPTKSSRITKEKPVAEAMSSKKKIQIHKSIKNDGSIQIPGVKITKLSLAGLRKDRNKNDYKIIKKTPKEVSVKLHDPNDFMTMFCNPDPFAATMTQDPFLASTLYYDDNWIFIQELEFKKWLNALMTPPEILTTDIESAPIDVGKVWQSCRTKEDVALAETKESVSARYHTNTRLNTLRKAAIVMLRKPEVINVLSQTTIAIEKEVLHMRVDKDLHRDIGLQKIILELFISYNPLWLRIGLETVYGETIPLYSNNDLIGLSRFLLNRFFSDPYLVKTHSSHLHPNIRLKTFQVAMNKFMLKKFLFIVYFLDYAKRNKLIGHDPCLFHKKATIKNSRSLLLTFARELLSGIGDITKVLRHYNYKVSHEQTFLDEYDYAVANLCTDLRDGVRLCKVMELVTGKSCLTCRCRVPAISRLQKVHNVGLALMALKEAGYVIAGDIDAKSIADGHKEKTMSLLWQIIYKFQAPRYEKAAKTLQKWWRSKLMYVWVKKILRDRRGNAASTIQRAWKCYLARKKLQILKIEYARIMLKKVEATRIIQRRWRLKKQAEMEQKQFQQIKTSTLKIQRWWRRIQFTRPYILELKRKQQLLINLQRRWQARQLMKLESARFVELKTSVTKIQTLWRARQLGKRVYGNYQNLRNAVTFIQKKWRAKLLMEKERKTYLNKLKAIKLIQEWWRRCSNMKQDRSHFMALKNSVKIIERVWIEKHTVIEERQRFLLQKNSAVTIQRAWRNYKFTKQDVQLIKCKKNACLKIQTWWRAVIAVKKYQKQRLSIILLQKRWRNIILMRKKKSVKMIEFWWSAIKLGRRVRGDYLRTRNAVILLQQKWRARMAMKKARGEFLKMKRAVVKIQSWYKMIIQKRYFTQYVKAATCLQIRWRARQKGKEIRELYLRKKSSTIKIQNKWRATRLTKSERSKFLQERKSAIVIQKHWRSFVLSREFKKIKNAVQVIEKWRKNIIVGKQIQTEFCKLKTAVIFCQRQWRTKQQMRKFKLQRTAATVIQKNWRSYKASKYYQNQRRSALVIQRWIRHLVLGRNVHVNFVQLKESTIAIQRHWRARQQMKKYKQQRQAAIVIQKTFRSYKASKSYQKQRQAALVIQKWRRHLVLGRNARANFVQLRKSTIVLQRHWRKRQQMKKFHQQQQAAILIQKHWKGVLARRNYEKKKIAVLFIENWRKHILYGKQIRKEYLETMEAVIKIQRLFRTKLQLKQFRKQREAAITIQGFWRSVLKMRECKMQYNQRKLAIIVLQRRYRARRIAVQVRRDYRTRCLAVVKIQRWWKNILHRRKMKMLEEKRRWAVSVIEHWWVSTFEQLRIRRIEKAELQKKWQNAVKIQAAWRGYQVRQAASKKLADLRERAQNAAKAAVPSATLASRLQENIEIFKYASNIGQLSICLASLDVITRLSPNACINVCQMNLVYKLYDILTKANRSLPWLDVCLKVISILLTLAKFEPTTVYVLKEEYIEVLVRLLNISVEKKEDLFLHTATLIWVLTEDKEYAEAVMSCSRTKYLLSSLYASINKKLSKSVVNVMKSKDSLPSPRPDWGLKHKRPRTFSSVSQAITLIASRLKILNMVPKQDMQRSFNFSIH